MGNLADDKFNAVGKFNRDFIMKKKQKEIKKTDEQNVWGNDSWIWIIAILAIFGFNGGCTTPNETNKEIKKEN